MQQPQKRPFKDCNLNEKSVLMILLHLWNDDDNV